MKKQKYYLSRLPPWDGLDYILELSMSVSVKGGVEKQLLFANYLKRWLPCGGLQARGDRDEPQPDGLRRTAGV